MSIGFLDPRPSIPDTSGLYRKIKEQQAEVERLQAKLDERGARMQIMYEALVSSGSSNRIPEIHKWFDNGEPK